MIESIALIFLLSFTLFCSLLQRKRGNSDTGRAVGAVPCVWDLHLSTAVILRRKYYGSISLRGSLAIARMLQMLSLPPLNVTLGSISTPRDGGHGGT